MYVNGGSNDPLSGFSVVTHSYTLKESYESRGGYGIDFGYTKSLSSKFSLQAGLGFNSIAFKRKTELIYDQSATVDDGVLVGQPIGDGSGFIVNFSSSDDLTSSDDKGETRINHLTIPVYALYNLNNKFQVGLGVRNSILISSKEVIQKYTTTPGNFQLVNSDDVLVRDLDDLSLSGQIVEEDDTSGNGFRSYNLIGSLFISYSITEKFAIRTTFDQGLNSFYEEEKQVAGEAKMRSVSLGVNYRL